MTVTCEALIVGAGMAGLAAADHLIAHNVDVQIIEAADRIGGRVHTIWLENGCAVDLGAQFFAYGMDQLSGMIRRFGLASRPVNLNGGAWLLDDAGLTHATASPVDDDFYALLYAADPNSFADMEQWLSSLDLPKSRLAILRSAIVELWGRDAATLAFAPMVRRASEEQDSALSLEFCLTDGAGALADALGAVMSDRIRLSSPARALRRTVGGYEVETDDKTIVARNVIIAVNPAVLRHIAWPDHPDIAAAAQMYAPGSILKATLFFESDFADQPVGAAWVARAAEPRGLAMVDSSNRAAGIFSATLFQGGDEAHHLAALSPGDARAAVVASASRFMGKGALKATHVIISNWVDDPYLGGGYSNWPLPSDGEDPDVVLAMPRDGLFFAGADLATDYFAHVEGALRSGLLAARKVMEPQGSGGEAG